MWYRKKIGILRRIKKENKRRNVIVSRKDFEAERKGSKEETRETGRK